MKNPRIFFAVLAGITTFIFIGWPFEIRFTWAPLNYWFVVLLCLALPISIWTAARTFEGKAIRVLGMAMSTFVGLISALPGACACIEAVDFHKSGYDASFEYLQEVSSGHYKYRLYRTNGGATTAFGLVLRRELQTPVGVKFVQHLWSKGRIANAELKLISDKEIQIREGQALIAAIKL